MGCSRRSQVEGSPRLQLPHCTTADSMEWEMNEHPMHTCWGRWATSSTCDTTYRSLVCSYVPLGIWWGLCCRTRPALQMWTPVYTDMKVTHEHTYTEQTPAYIRTHAHYICTHKHTHTHMPTHSFIILWLRWWTMHNEGRWMSDAIVKKCTVQAAACPLHVACTLCAAAGMQCHLGVPQQSCNCRVLLVLIQSARILLIRLHLAFKHIWPASSRRGGVLTTPPHETTTPQLQPYTTNSSFPLTGTMQCLHCRCRPQEVY